MPITVGDLLGHSQIGVYVSVVGEVLFIPESTPEDDVERIEHALEMESTPITIGGSSLLGSLMVGNSRGMAVADIGAGTGWLGGWVHQARSTRRSSIPGGASAAVDVTIVESSTRVTNLPDLCCDGLFMRRVYHHPGNAAAINASLYDAVKPTGLFIPLRGCARTGPTTRRSYHR